MRFACPTSNLELPKLRRISPKRVVCALLVTFAVHGFGFFFNPVKVDSGRTPRPLEVKFIKREPRLTKSFELRKIPVIRRQLQRRETRFTQANIEHIQQTAVFDARKQVMNAAHKGGSFIGESRVVHLSPVSADLHIASAIANPGREPDNKIDMNLEMMDVNSLDTGRYQAMVVQDRQDNQAIKGFVKFVHACSARSKEYGSSRDIYALAVRTIDVIRDAVNEYTGLQADFVGSITYDDSRLLDIPILIPDVMYDDKIGGDPNENELRNLSAYVLGGGFILGHLTAPMQEGLIKYGGLVNGKDLWQEVLPEDHAVFSSFFDIGGVPGTMSSTWGKTGMIGYFVKGRLVAVGAPWDRLRSLYLIGGDSGGYQRCLQLAVNVIVYALTQEGSVTQRLMQFVN